MLGRQLFEKKGDIRLRCQTIRKQLKPGSKVTGVDFDFCADLFTWHHEFIEKLEGKDLHSMKVDFYKGRYKTESKNFWIRSSHGEWVAISFEEAIAKRDVQSVQDSRFKTALRVLVDPQILQFRDGRRGGHVDHTGNEEFRHIVHNFVDSMKIDVMNLEYEPMPDFPFEQLMFTDKNLQEEWIRFHECHAELRLVSIEENLSKKRAFQIKI